MVIYEWPNTDCKLYCLDAVTGDEIYNATLGNGSPVDSPALYNNRIYISVYDRETMETYLYCANALNGNVLWQKNILGNLFGSSPVIYDDTVIVSSTFWDGENTSGIIWCLDVETGAEQWNCFTNGVCNVWSTPAVAYSNIYIALSEIWVGPDDMDGRGEMRCLNASNGDLIWNRTFGDWLYSSPAVADGKVYINSIDYWELHGDAYCLDAADGSILWQYWLLIGEYSSPAVANGRLYMATPHLLYAFDDASPSNNPPKTTITGPPKGKVGRKYNHTIFADDPEGENVFLIVEFSIMMPGWDAYYRPSGEPVIFTGFWPKGEHFIRARAQDVHYAWGNWTVFMFNITEIDVKPTFLLGSIESVEQEGDYTFITVNKVLSIRLLPPNIRLFSSGEEIVISSDYLGFLGSHFIFGRFKADLD